MAAPLSEIADTPASMLAKLERGATAEEALSFFDSLPPMAAIEMRGFWRGGGLRTGHPLDGMLELFGWRGKRFDGPDAVHPLVFGRPGAMFSVNPSLAPLGLVLRYGRFIESPAVAPIARAALGILRTKEPKARLRMTEFRGVTTATMVYNSLPIHDVFRRVDADTALGLMDRRGDKAPNYFYFVLRREGAATVPRRDGPTAPVRAGRPS
jgi:Domain of unknown function (DUF4334)/GXWXG protein